MPKPSPFAIGYTALILLGSALTCWISWPYIEDDAFIHLEYAYNVATRLGFTFDSHVVFADSAPGWVLLLAGLMKVGFSGAVAVKIAGCLGLVIAVMGLRALAENVITSPTIRHLFLACVLVNPFFLRWSFSGMEAVMALGCAAFALAFVAVPAGSRRAAVARLALVSLLPLLRFEGLLLCVFAVLAIGLDWRALTRCSMKKAALVAMTTFVPIGLWLLYAFIHFGRLTPTTGAAKRVAADTFGGAVLVSAIQMVRTTAFGYGIALGALGLGALLFHRKIWAELQQQRLENPRVLRTLAAVFAWPVAVIAFYLAYRTCIQTRYVLVFGPFLLLGAISLFERAERPRWLSTILLATLAFYLAFAGVSVFPLLRAKGEMVVRRTAFCQQLAILLPPKVPIATFGIGQFAFELPNPIIDTGGIAMPGGLPYLLDEPGMVAWAESQGAQCFIVGGDRAPSPAYHLTSAMKEPFGDWSPWPSRYTKLISLSLFCRGNIGVPSPLSK